MADAGTLLPSDKDEYTLQDGKIRQTRCRMQVDDLAAVFTIRVVGKADEVVPLTLGFRKGTKVLTATLKSKFDELASTPLTALKTSGTVESSVMDTDDGLFCNWEGKVRIPFVSKPEVDDGDYQMTKSAVWDETSCQYQYPLERYAGETGGDGPTEQEFPDAGKFEAWKNENGSDATRYRAFKAEIDGQEIDLEHRTLALAKKVYAGKQQVERYYPEVTRTTTYRYIEAAGDDIDEAMPSILAEIDESPNLARIDTEPDDVWEEKFPDVAWLKVAYNVRVTPCDVEEYYDAVVTEVWRGIDLTEETDGWDKNLYGSGADRWKFYPNFEVQSQPQGGSGGGGAS